MADVRWTKSQQDAINARRGTVLVAAAAGSGKTAVLVQRALERLTDPDAPTSADRMLIVTFTRAAAAEMKERLKQGIANMLKESPNSRELRRQVLLISQAHIGTVDSFCSDVVREFFHLLDIAPDYKIMSDKQESELIADALNDAVQNGFDDGSINELADAFAGARDDKKLSEMVLTLYRYMQSHPFPEKWLREKVGLYFAGDPAPWTGVITDYVRETAEHYAMVCDTAVREAAECGGRVGEVYSEAFTADRAQLVTLGRLATAGNWDELATFLSGISWQRQGAIKKSEQDSFSDRMKATRDEMKKTVGGLAGLVCRTKAQCVAELHDAAPVINSLMNLTLDFSRRYDEKKRARGFVDYSDLEHYAIKLFLDENGQPTQTAKEVSARFDEIMIDEFQDTNEVQEAIFRAISRNAENLFMVGDVKQSIYGFRRAAPEIFINRRASYQKYDSTRDEYPAYIVLDRNFRSRKNVTDSVNFVFSLLMSQRTGGVDYTGEERLAFAAEGYAERNDCETEMVFMSKPSTVPAEEAEAKWIASRIKEIMDSGFEVKTKEGTRPAKPSDFCILLRSANKYAHAYAKELAKQGVPAKATVTGGFFDAAEVNTVLALLQVIDNPNQDIPLLAVLMSPVYGFSADDAARLRADSKRVSVYVSLTAAAKTDQRCADVLREIGQYRDIAATMPADEFLTYLYGKTGITDIVAAMPGGADRVENLRLLQSYAGEYEDSGYHGISGFVRFLDRLQKNGNDLQAGEASPDTANAVSIMSIHKSKGLEFPVCIVAGCGRGFVSDSRADVLLHPELGIGVKLKHPKYSASFTTTAREAIALECDRTSASEELRVLYVAMTRAKEKLIMLGSGEDMEKLAKKKAVCISDSGISHYVVRECRSILEWMMLCALCHPDGETLRQAAECDSSIICRSNEDATPWTVSLCRYDRNDYLTEEVRVEDNASPDAELYDRLTAQLTREYRHGAAVGVPAKVSASRLAAEQGASRKITLSRPAWMGEKGMTPTERGTALHEFMQFADFAAALSSPQDELDRLVRQAYLTPEQAAAVDLNRVAAFVKGRLGQRVLAAEFAEREKRFTAEIPASLVRPDSAVGEKVILQGAVDCIFAENGRLNIIDFKTDRVKTMDELWEHYEPQLRLYAAAMKEVVGLPVGEMIIYSTHLNESSAREYTENE